MTFLFPLLLTSCEFNRFLHQGKAQSFLLFVIVKTNLHQFLIILKSIILLITTFVVLSKVTVDPQLFDNVVAKCTIILKKLPSFV